MEGDLPVKSDEWSAHSSSNAPSPQARAVLPPIGIHGGAPIVRGHVWVGRGVDPGQMHVAMSEFEEGAAVRRGEAGTVWGAGPYPHPSRGGRHSWCVTPPLGRGYPRWVVELSYAAADTSIAAVERGPEVVRVFVGFRDGVGEQKRKFGCIAQILHAPKSHFTPLRFTVTFPPSLFVPGSFTAHTFQIGL